MSIKGIPFIGKVKEFLWKPIYVTIQKVGNSRAALDVVNRGYYLIDTNPIVVEAGSTDGLLVKTGHSFKVGDSIRLTNTANGIDEQEIIIDEIIDANTVKFAGYLSAPLVAGDEYFHRRPTAELLASDGTRLASLSFIEERTAGNETAVPVRRSYVSDLNTHALPVEVMGADGMVLNVTTGDVNMQLRHDDRIVNTVSVPGDSVKIGNGLTGASGRILSIEQNATDSLFEAHVHDTDLLAELKLKANLTEDQPVLSKAKATAAAPSYDEGSNGQLSQDLSGRLRVTAIGATASNVDGHATAANGHVPTMAHLMGFNGTTYDRLRSTINDGLEVNIKKAVALSGTMAIDQTTDGTTNKVYVGNVPHVLIDSTNIDIRALTAVKDTVSLGGAEFQKVTDVLGTTADAAAATDVGTFTLIQILKRGLVRWTNLLDRIPASLGAKLGAASFSVVQASDNTFLVKQAQPSLLYQQSLVIADTGVTVLTGPTGARGCKVMAGYGNSADLKFTVDGVTNPAANIGFELQPGRSEDFEGALEVRVIAKTAATNQEIYVHWRA